MKFGDKNHLAFLREHASEPLPESPKEVVYPECEKMKKIKPKSQAIGEFIDWLRGVKHIYLYERQKVLYDRTDDEGNVIGQRERTEVLPTKKSLTDLLAEFFEIDMVKVDQEQKAILEKARSETPA